MAVEKLQKISTPAHTYISTDFDCGTKADGFYSIGCKSEFISCTNNQTTVYECPQNLIFNEKLQACDLPENINGCPKVNCSDDG